MVRGMQQTICGGFCRSHCLGGGNLSLAQTATVPTVQVDELRFTPGQAAVVAGHRSVFLRNLAILLCRRQEACSALQVRVSTLRGRLTSTADAVF